MHFGEKVQSGNNRHVQQEHEGIEPVPGAGDGRLVVFVRYIIFQHSDEFMAKSRI